MCHHSTYPCIYNMVSVYLLLYIYCWSRWYMMLYLRMCYRSIDIFYNILQIHHHNSFKLGICKYLIMFLKYLLYHRYHNFQKLNKSSSCNDKRGTINSQNHHNNLLRICMWLRFEFAQIHCYRIGMMSRSTMSKLSMSNDMTNRGQYLELHFRNTWSYKRIDLQRKIKHDDQLLNRMLNKSINLGKFYSHICKQCIANQPHHHNTHLSTGREQLMHSNI